MQTYWSLDNIFLSFPHNLYPSVLSANSYLALSTHTKLTNARGHQCGNRCETKNPPHSQRLGTSWQSGSFHQKAKSRTSSLAKSDCWLQLTASLTRKAILYMIYMWTYSWLLQALVNDPFHLPLDKMQ